MNCSSLCGTGDRALLLLREEEVNHGACGWGILAGGILVLTIYYKACKKGDPEAKAVAVDEGPVAALANASEITGLPRDNFEVHEISKEEFEKLRPFDDR